MTSRDSKRDILLLPEGLRAGSRGASNNCVGEQNSDYLLRKTKT